MQSQKQTVIVVDCKLGSVLKLMMTCLEIHCCLPYQQPTLWVVSSVKPSMALVLCGGDREYSRMHSPICTLSLERINILCFNGLDFSFDGTIRRSSSFVPIALTYVFGKCIGFMAEFVNTKLQVVSEPLKSS